MDHVDTSKAQDFIWLTWKLVGVYPILDYTIYHRLHMICVFVFVNILSIVVFVTQLFYVTNLKYLLDNLPMNILIIGTTFKFLTVLLMRRRILGINKALEKLDECAVSSLQKDYLLDLIKFCNKLVVCGFLCYEVVDIMAGVNAAFSKRQRLLYEIWLPYNWRATAFSYWVTFFGQFIAQTFLALQSVASDFSGPVYLLVLTAQLKNIMGRIEHINFNSNKINRELIIQCFKDHFIVSEVFHVLQGTVSYITFVQFVGTALALVLIALNYLLFSPSYTEMLTLVFFAVAEILQILPCCYYSNKFMWTTDQIVTSLYSSNWYNQSCDVKKLVIIFMQMTQKKKVIIAGKVIPVTMTTFAAILKFSYSLLMVLIRVNN